jgi:hypothetical protein
VQQESSPQPEGTIRATSKSPDQRTDATGRRGAHRAPDETLILPGFITGKKEPEPPPVPSPDPEPELIAPAGPELSDALPPSERGMLIFVATLLGVGTLAVVTVLGLGGFSSPEPTAGAAPVPSVTTTTASPSPSPSPSPSASPSRPPSPTPKKSTAPARVSLGALTANDPRAFCAANNAGRVAQKEDHSWYCRGSSSHPPMPFTSTDVCRWRYLDKSAYAIATNIDDPATWKCYT